MYNTYMPHTAHETHRPPPRGFSCNPRTCPGNDAAFLASSVLVVRMWQGTIFPAHPGCWKSTFTANSREATVAQHLSSCQDDIVLLRPKTATRPLRRRKTKTFTTHSRCLSGPATRSVKIHRVVIVFYSESIHCAVAKTTCSSIVAAFHAPYGKTCQHAPNKEKPYTYKHSSLPPNRRDFWCVKLHNLRARRANPY